MFRFQSFRSSASVLGEEKKQDAEDAVCSEDMLVTPQDDILNTVQSEDWYQVRVMKSYLCRVMECVLRVLKKLMPRNFFGREVSIESRDLHR